METYITIGDNIYCNYDSDDGVSFQGVAKLSDYSSEDEAKAAAKENAESNMQSAIS